MNKEREMKKEVVKRKMEEKDLIHLLDETLVAEGEQNSYFQMFGCVTIC